MNIWLAFASVFLAGMFPAIIVCMRGRTMARLVALQLVQVIAVIVLLLLAEGFGRGIYFDMPLALAVFSLASSLVFARFLERWL